MAEDKYIQTGTNVTINNTDIDIYVYYNPTGELQLNFFVPNSDTLVQGIPFQAGDLGYTYEGIADLFEINTSGDLFVNSATPDRYSINANGDLIYTT